MPFLFVGFSAFWQVIKFSSSLFTSYYFMNLFILYSYLQVEFAHKFLPEEVENLAVWQHVSLKALNPDLGKRVAHQLCVAGLAQCRRWLNSRRAVGELQPVVKETGFSLWKCLTSGFPNCEDAVAVLSFVFLSVAPLSSITNWQMHNQELSF